MLVALLCVCRALAQIKPHEQSHLTARARATPGTNTTAQNVVAIEAVSVCTTGGELAVKNVGVEAYVSTNDSAASARNAKVVPCVGLVRASELRDTRALCVLHRNT